MTAALVTTFNEAGTIGRLVTALKEVVDSVLVVDDPNTTDGTELAAFLAGADTLVPDETGIGPCLMAGMAQLRGRRIVVVDAGDSHLSSIPSIPRMEQYQSDVVIGSRFRNGAGYYGRSWRKKASQLYARGCNRRTGRSISDWTSGFRLYSPRAVSAVLERRPCAIMHGWQPQSLAACLAKNLTVSEYPITYRAGRSSMNRAVAWEAIQVMRSLPCS